MRGESTSYFNGCNSTHNVSFPIVIFSSIETRITYLVERHAGFDILMGSVDHDNCTASRFRLSYRHDRVMVSDAIAVWGKPLHVLAGNKHVICEHEAGLDYDEDDDCSDYREYRIGGEGGVNIHNATYFEPSEMSSGYGGGAMQSIDCFRSSTPTVYFPNPNTRTLIGVMLCQP